MGRTIACDPYGKRRRLVVLAKPMQSACQSAIEWHASRKSWKCKEIGICEIVTSTELPEPTSAARRACRPAVMASRTCERIEWAQFRICGNPSSHI